ncbi:clumping factor A-like [Engraulis encrasicolus]|uniref:clumping factor A-like n=1 Tax=Engraulis encrasicolus TaxID=184585 RepID=UPI002FD644C1
MRFPVLVVLVVLLNALVCDDQQIQTRPTPQQPKVSTYPVKDVSPGKGKDQQKDQLSEDDVTATTAHTPLDETTPESTEHNLDVDEDDGQGDDDSSQGDGDSSQAAGDDGLSDDEDSNGNSSEEGEDDTDSQAEDGQGDSAEDSDGQSSEDSDGQSSEDSDGQSSEDSDGQSSDGQSSEEGTAVHPTRDRVIAEKDAVARRH